MVFEKYSLNHLLSLNRDCTVIYITRWLCYLYLYIQGVPVPKAFIHLKWAVCGEMVHLKKIWGNTKWRKVSSPHYLKNLMKLNKHCISYSLKRDSRTISKMTLYANLRSSPIDTELWYFFKKNGVCYSSQQYLGLNEVSWMALLNNFFNFASSLKKLKLNINWANTQIGTKCDFRDRPRITFEAVADAMFA